MLSDGTFYVKYMKNLFDKLCDSAYLLNDNIQAEYKYLLKNILNCLSK